MKNDDKKQQYIMNSPTLDGLVSGAGWGLFFLIAAGIVIAILASC